MKTLRFKCTLLTDVVLNVKSASEGVNTTLDFIPGSCFLGIVADRMYERLSAADAFTLFHSGRVRFGDAHPSKCGVRGHRIPASFYYAKGDSIFDACYIHHHITDPDAIRDSQGAAAQLKQSRTGFYLLGATIGEEIATSRSYAVKSAHDRLRRKSKDNSLYGYESLSRGVELLFSVEFDDDHLVDIVCDSLVGERRIGRSRTSQYGLVRIVQCDYADVGSYEDHDMVVVYADSRLVFLDEYGSPTFQPTVEQLLGVGAKGEISWADSQIRTFQYAPWNYRRQCYDTDRCGIEKGSVIVIKDVAEEYSGSHHVGSYLGEGFGRVLFNPVFMSHRGPNGLSMCQFKEAAEHTPAVVEEASVIASPLYNFLLGRQSRDKERADVYKKVNEWKGASLFKGGEAFASQWGTIRSIALQCRSNEDIESKVKDYISHGVKADNWVGKRSQALEKFMEDNRDNLWAAIINLASEMAKKCSK